jgi:Right handed beta helix region
MNKRAALGVGGAAAALLVAAGVYFGLRTNRPEEGPPAPPPVPAGAGVGLKKEKDRPAPPYRPAPTRLAGGLRHLYTGDNPRQVGVKADTITPSTYYVAPTGSDANPGTLLEPFGTLNHAAAALQPGDTLYIRGGTYPEALRDAIPGGTSWSAPVTVAAYPGETVIVQPSAAQAASRVLSFASRSHAYIEVDNLVLDGTNITDDVVKITWSSAGGASNHIRLRNCEVRNGPAQGINVQGDPTQGQNPDGNEFLGCKVHDNGGTSALNHGFYLTSSSNLVDGCDVYANAGYGVQIYHSAAHDSLWCSDNTVRNNRIHGNDTSGNCTGGVVVANGDDNLVYNNLVYGNAGGIQVGYGANNTGVYNNTCVDNAGSYTGGFGVVVGANGGATNTSVRNNICYRNGRGGVDDQGTGTVADHNSGNTTDPLFVNAAGNDYHLRVGSPAIDAGVAIASVATDYYGVTRLIYDLGAIEYVATLKP